MRTYWEPTKADGTRIVNGWGAVNQYATAGEMADQYKGSMVTDLVAVEYVTDGPPTGEPTGQKVVLRARLI